MSYTHLYVPITTYGWDKTSKNDDSLKKSDKERFCGKDSQGSETVSETGVISPGYLKAGLLD